LINRNYKHILYSGQQISLSVCNKFNIVNIVDVVIELECGTLLQKVTELIKRFICQHTK
jgi:hypothetical protein